MRVDRSTSRMPGAYARPFRPGPDVPSTGARAAPRDQALSLRRRGAARARAPGVAHAGPGARASRAGRCVRRGLADAPAARAWLQAAEAHDPAAFAGMDEAVALVRRHVGAGSRIVVHGDYDVGGVCSTAVLLRALRRLGADVGCSLPSRGEDGYGLSLRTVERLARDGTGLLVTADCAITAVPEVAAARASGIDVLVTDHHAPRADGALPDAPTVHPALCGYPCPELCATGVAYKLAEAVWHTPPEEDVDIVALEIVADVVSVCGENRRLVREGLRALAATAK